MSLPTHCLGMRAYCLTCAQIFSRALVIILLFLGLLSLPRVGIVRAASLAPNKESGRV